VGWERLMFGFYNNRLFEAGSMEKKVRRDGLGGEKGNGRFDEDEVGAGLAGERAFTFCVVPRGEGEGETGQREHLGGGENGYHSYCEKGGRKRGGENRGGTEAREKGSTKAGCGYSSGGGERRLRKTSRW